MSTNTNWSQLLLDKVVIVTGAAGAIGAAIAQTCAIHGARVVVADIDKTAADEIATKIIGDDQSKNDYVLTITLDVANEESIQNAVQTVVDKWGTVDVLVNNAASFIFGAVENVSVEDWTTILNVNIRGCALMVKAVVPYMKKQRSGSIIQMSSINGYIGQPEFVPYSTTKGAVLQMTRNLAFDLGPFNIRCNTICPGAILTPATTRHAANLKMPLEELIAEQVRNQCLKRLGITQEVANFTVFLGSDLCNFVTGANIIVDGGFTTI